MFFVSTSPPLWPGQPGKKPARRFPFLRSPRFSSLIGFLVYVMLGLGLLERTALAIPPVQRTILPNQLVLLVSEEHSLPLVTLQLLVDAGSWRDPQGKEGLAYVTANGLLLGTSKHRATVLNELLDFIGASLDASGGRDYATLSLQILKKDLDQGLDLFLEALTQPTFPEEEIRREIEKTLGSIQAAEDQPTAVATKAFQKALFPSGPYDHPVEGTRDSLPKLSRELLVDFYRTYYHPNNAILAVVGDITLEEAQAKLLLRLTAWPQGKIPKSTVNPQFAQGPEKIQIDRPITQANIMIGHGGISRENPDYYALTVMNYILGGGGFASRLVEEIRSARGLAYSVRSSFDPGRYPGPFQIVLQTKNASAREAISLALQQMERLQKEMVSDKELEGAKKYLVGSFPLRLGTQANLAGLLVQVEYYGLGLDYPERYPSLIRSVTREDVLRVARTYLHPESCILVVVANLKEAKLD